MRIALLERACADLGVVRVVLLHFRDSGMAGTLPNQHSDAFRLHVGRAAAPLADLLLRENVESPMSYDSDGIYRHPDHLTVHKLGRVAARLARASSYEATVNRAALPVVGRHLCGGRSAHSLRSTIGRTMAHITTVVNADPVESEIKLSAMAAHQS
jgi:LmbE family N-acetylglucosaminyl deacetylase